MTKVSDYLAKIGSKGGKATGERKKRTPEQYRDMAKKSAQVRKAKRASDSGDAIMEQTPEQEWPECYQMLLALVREMGTDWIDRAIDQIYDEIERE
jgi:hypothetical protein